MKKTILVVEDLVSIRQFVCDTLEKKGYKTLFASNGIEAFKVVQSSPTEIDLVLSDYNMPICTGLELLKKIKNNSELARIPVVFLTTESAPEKMKIAKEAGLSAWIKKPYRPETFFALIENIMTTTKIEC